MEPPEEPATGSDRRGEAHSGTRSEASQAAGATAGRPATPRAGAQREDRSRGGLLGFLAELPALMLVAFVLAVLLKTFILQAFWIPSESMVPTLEVNDRVLVNKLAYRVGDPERGDIVVFSDPAEAGDVGFLDGLWESLTSGFGLTQPGEEDFIKRLVGLPGETIEIIGGTIHVDGQPVRESLTTEGGYLGGVTEDFGPVTVPEGEYFVMGDNRPFSADSRSLLGTIPRDDLVGRAFVLIWPLDRARLLSSPEYDLQASAAIPSRAVTPQYGSAVAA